MRKRDKLILLFLFGTQYGGIGFCLTLIGMLMWLFILTAAALIILFIYQFITIVKEMEKTNLYE